MRSHRLTRPGIRFVIAIVMVASLSGCRAISDKYVIQDEPATLEAIAGTDRSTVTLTPKAAERLGIDTVEVESGELGLSVPSAALIIDPNGGFWVYLNPEPLTYVRAELTDIHQEGQTTFYASGPEVGSPVVTVGVPELYGAETGIGK